MGLVCVGVFFFLEEEEEERGAAGKERRPRGDAATWPPAPSEAGRASCFRFSFLTAAAIWVTPEGGTASGISARGVAPQPGTAPQRSPVRPPDRGGLPPNPIEHELAQCRPSHCSLRGVSGGFWPRRSGTEQPQTQPRRHRDPGSGASADPRCGALTSSSPRALISPNPSLFIYIYLYAYTSIFPVQLTAGSVSGSGRELWTSL